MLIIPAIDLKNGQCVRLTQGRKNDVKVYDADPIAVAKRFEADDAQMIHVVDLDGAFAEGRSRNREVAKQIIASVGVAIEFGGGMRTASDVAELIAAGAQRVVIGTLAVESPETLKLLIDRFGSRIVVGVDAKNGQVVTRGWEKQESLRAIDLARRVAEAGVERIVYTDISRDGMLEGINIEETSEIARESGLKVTASGGVSSLADIALLKQAEWDGVDSVIIGKALYERRITLKDALSVAGA
jgi:phosphoribosylformimino-5-aminoimidazole carboxamide ribotide isomerase